jgi:biopolymer transport protein ExbB/TolQ
MEHISLIKLFSSFAMLGAEWVMWLLVGLSLLSMAVLLERVLYFRGLNDDLGELGESINKRLRVGDVEGARTRLEKSPSPAALVALSGLSEDRNAHAVERIMASTLARVRPMLERNLNVLGTIGSTAPFIGLFGTVIGIIQAFDALKTPDGVSGAAAAAASAAATGRVMGTIAEALVATAIGLGVAIPAVIAFNFLNKRIKLILGSTEVLSQLVMAHAFDRHHEAESLVGSLLEGSPAARERAQASVARTGEVMG